MKGSLTELVTQSQLHVIQLGKSDANDQKSNLLFTLTGKKQYPRPDILLWTNETPQALQAKTNPVLKMARTRTDNKQME